MAVKALKIKITGKVQGVFFRNASREKAWVWNLSGWAKNDADGGVSIWVEGQEDNLQKFLKWCYNGPEGAKVDEVKAVEQVPNLSFDDFSIIR